MQPLESFTAIANVLGRQRQVSFNELDGLTFDNLSGREATVLVGVVEKLDGQLLAHLLAGRALIVDPSTIEAPAGPVQPDGAPNQAQWQPAAPRPAAKAPTSPEAPAKSAPVSSARPEPTAPVAPPPASEPTKADTGALCAQDEPESGIEGWAKVEAAGGLEPEIPVDKPAPVLAIVEPEATPAPAPSPKVTTPTAAEVLGKTASPTPKAKSKSDKKKAAPPRGAALYSVGSEYKGAKVAKIVEHSDGGRLLVLEDGARVKLNKKGKEVARTDAPPADIDLSGDLTPASEIKLKPKKEKAAEGEYPKTIMETRIAREVIEYLMSTGIEGLDAITVKCLELKAQGAKAFSSSPDDDAVRRRVRSSLTIMDRA